MAKPVRWFTSDFHFSHKNVIEYCNRPYFNVHDMNKSLTEEWNYTVQPYDEVYFLGDFSLNKKTASVVTPLLNGRKILIPGNHDACFKFNPKLPNDSKCVEATKLRQENLLKLYTDAGWEGIHQTLQLTLKNGTTVLLAHLPYTPEANSGYDDRFLEYRPKDEGLVLLHGHLHGRYIKYKRMIDVGIDAWDQGLVSEDTLIKLIDSDEYFVPSSLTEWYKTRKKE